MQVQVQCSSGAENCQEQSFNNGEYQQSRLMNGKEQPWGSFPRSPIPIFIKFDCSYLKSTITALFQRSKEATKQLCISISRIAALLCFAILDLNMCSLVEVGTWEVFGDHED
ncbi:hypothetical protein Peur_029448 [Populus x canadensis]